MRGVVATLAVLALCACDQSRTPPPKFRLEGSLTQVMDLSYDEVRLLIAPNDISLQFVRIKPLESLELDGGSQMMGVSEDYPIKVAYILNGEPPPAGGRVDLAETIAGGQRGVLSRNVQNDPRNTFPEILRGTISFDRPIETGQTVSGDFHITFVNGVEVASGRTVFTTAYTAKVQ